jgi:hypothetical protein
MNSHNIKTILAVSAIAGTVFLAAPHVMVGIIRYNHYVANYWNKRE